MDDVGGHDMAVQVGITVAIDRVREAARDDATGRHHRPFAALSTYGRNGMGLEIGHGAVHGAMVGCHHGARHLLTSQPEEHAGRLGGAEGQVESSTRRSARSPRAAQ